MYTRILDRLYIAFIIFAVLDIAWIAADWYFFFK
jgi:hypothetical protein